MIAGSVSPTLLAVVIAASIVIAPPAGWTSDAEVAGKSALISVANGKQKIKSVQKGSGVHFGPSSASSELSGKLEIWYVDTPTTRSTVLMPSPWASNTGATATYRNTLAPAGPSVVKIAKLRNGSTAKVIGKGTGGINLASPPGPGGVMTVLTIANAGDGSTHRMCSLYRVAQGSKVVHKITGSGFKLKLSKGVPAPCPTPPPPGCSDGIRNGTETGIDCGGTTCPACPGGDECDGPEDCASGICITGVCHDATCTDGIKDGTETDTDCGGGACDPCDAGDDCQLGGDCTSLVCTLGVCQAPNCHDGVKNGGEVDVDCGGPCSACVPFTVHIDSPAHGIFTLASSVPVTGHTTGVGPAGADLTINGTPVALQPGGTFSTNVPLDQGIVFNPMYARLSRHFDGHTAYDRVVVIAGASIADGAYSPNAVAMRVNDSGLDTIEPVATTLIDIDPATFVTPGTVVLGDYCYLPLGSLCLGSVDVTISGTPPPSIGPVGIALDSQTGSVEGDITLQDLRVTVNIDTASGLIPIHCELHLHVPLTELTGNFDLSPLAAAPSQVDVTQLGPVDVEVTGVSNTTDCSGLFGDLTESLIGTSIGDVGALFSDGMEDTLNAVDGEGNTPIAGAIESSLAGIDIAGPVGSGLGIDLDAPFTSIVEDPTGITLAANVSAVTLVPDPAAPDLTASYHVNEAFPTFGATTPVQHVPYGVGFGISTSGFNQLLRSQIESGLLRTTLTEFDLGTGPIPLTAGLLSFAFPPFAIVPPATPITIRIAPTLAPVLTGNAGPAGELGEVRMAHMLVEFVEDIGLPTETVHLALAVDSRLGLQLAFQPGGIGFAFAAPTATDVLVAPLDNPLGITEASLQAFIPGVVASFLPQIAGALETFPLPEFIGFSLGGLEVSRNGQYYSIFADLEPACDDGSQCPSGVCLNDVCQPPSCTDGVKNGAETALDCGGGSCPGCAVGQPCFLNPDCAVGGCSGGVCQPPCTANAQCPSGVCATGYCRAPNCADGVENGTETDLDCGGPAPSCLRCGSGASCGAASDCQSSVCTGNLCQPPTCTDGVRNGTETDLDCGGGGCPGCALGKQCGAAVDCASNTCGANAHCTCGSQLFTFTVSSNNGGSVDSAEWPGGSVAQNGPAGCSVTINRPNNNVDLTCTLASSFSVAGFSGYSQCFGSGGEDGDGCEPVSCPPAGIGSCCSGRPSCSAALNGSATARYRVQCLE